MWRYGVNLPLGKLDQYDTIEDVKYNVDGMKRGCVSFNLGNRREKSIVNDKYDMMKEWDKELMERNAIRILFVDDESIGGELKDSSSWEQSMLVFEVHTWSNEQAFMKNDDKRLAKKMWKALGAWFLDVVLIVYKQIFF